MSRRFILLWKKPGHPTVKEHTEFASREAAVALGEKGKAAGWVGYLVAEVVHDA